MRLYYVMGSSDGDETDWSLLVWANDVLEAQGLYWKHFGFASEDGHSIDRVFKVPQHPTKVKALGWYSDVKCVWEHGRSTIHGS